MKHVFFTRYFFIFTFCMFLTRFAYSEEVCNVEQIKANIQKLGDTNYKNREAAKKELSQLPNNCRKILVAELKVTQNLEIKERLQGILDQSKDNLIELFGEHYLKSQSLFKEKKFEDALKELNKIFEIDDEYEMALQIQYKILEAKGEYKKCIEILKKNQLTLKEGSNESLELEMKIFQLQIKDTNFKEAISFLENNMAKKPEDNRLALMLANLYEMNRQPNKSEELQLKVIAKQDTSGMNSTLAWFYIRQNELEKAKTYLQKSSSNANDTLTQILDCFYLGNTQKSLELINQKSEELIKELKDQKEVSNASINDSDVLLLFYRNFFEISLKKSATIKFKSLYEAFSEDAKKAWPIPLIGYYAGSINIEQLEKIMDDNNPYDRRQKRCEGYFYAGLLKLCDGNIVDAKKYFTLSKDQQIFDYIETTASFYFLNNTK